MIHFTFKNTEISITWRMWLIVAATAMGIYLGGFQSGYSTAQAKFSLRADARDKTTGEIKASIAQLPAKTAEKTAAALKDEK
ncbi:hypothetical protein [Sodalis sp. dw_96]|uniref:hypothetical protein n=1 Tax=Sodalis sp. dw_96 TaxID=2719794 RepID=UPI001BD4D629|nr:hypothetical protein [Sodalis sp. dw_96]